MQQFSNQMRVMESGNHFKNGVSLKKLRSSNKPYKTNIYLFVVICMLLFGTGNMYAQNWQNLLRQAENAARTAVAEKAKAKESQKRAEAEAAKRQNPSNPTRQANNANSNIVGNRSPKSKTPFITSVISPHARFTNTFVQGDGGYYVISYTDGHLYRRVWDESKKEYTEEQLILENVKEIYCTSYLLQRVEGILGNNNKIGTSFFAVKNDGSLWVWGNNEVGQLGDNTGINKTEPAKIMDNVRDIRVYSGSVCVLKNDGTVYVWGANSVGQLGVGDFDNRYSPVKLPFENVSYIYRKTEDWSCGPGGGFLSAIRIVTLSGDEYKLAGRTVCAQFAGKSELIGKYDYNVYFESKYNAATRKTEYRYKLMPDGNLYRDDNLLASNVAFAGEKRLYSYITKNGELFLWGSAPIGDGSNIPRKEPVSVLRNIIQFNLYRHALSSDGKLYKVDTENTFKYEVFASDVYLFMSSNNLSDMTGYSSMDDNNYYSDGGYYTNDGTVYMMNYYSEKYSLFLKDVALPKIK